MSPTLGIIGLNPSSIDFATLAMQSGYNVIAYDEDKARCEQIQERFFATSYFDEFTETLPSKRVVWSFLEDGNVLDELLQNYISYFSVGDIVIDLSISNVETLTARMRYAQGFQIDLMDAVVEKVNNEFQCWIGGNRFAFNFCEPLMQKIFGEQRYHYCGLIGHALLVSQKDE